MTDAVRYKLNNWSIVSSADPYQAPELRQQCLIGEVEGHTKWEDGHTIVTSRIIGQYKELIVTAGGSLIELGEPSEEYEANFPNAKWRLLESTPIVSPPKREIA